MLFQSLTFAVFLPLVFLIYWRIGGPKRKAQNILLLLASYTFYAAWDWRFLGLIFVSSLTDYFVGLRMARHEDQASRKPWLWLSLAVNLSLLGFFKYFNFFADSLIDLFGLLGIGLSPTTLDILLPVGISFYTFQTLSYTIDIYRGQLRPTHSALDFFAFVSFFPQLVAGPIERAQNLLPQFQTERRFDPVQATRGLRLFLWGLFKKIVIADGFGVYVDYIYGQPDVANGLSWWMASALFGFQVYADFSAYSTMARGVARLFGFELMVNFRAPFSSRSIREFWSRWHISLNTWFRDYIYFPLGGNRSTTAVWARNIIITFFVSGIWHGAGWGFILFGLFHGIGYVVEQRIFSRVNSRALGRFLKPIFAYLVIVFAWNQFRNTDTDSLLSSMGAMLNPMTWSLSDAFFWLEAQPLILGLGLALLAALMFAFEGRYRDRAWEVEMEAWPAGLRWGLYFSLVLLMLAFGQFSSVQPFIYFQF